MPFGALSAGMDTAALVPPGAPPAPIALADTPPQFDGPVPLPRDRPKEADDAPAGDAATNLSSASQAPPSAPLDIRPPTQTAPLAPAAAPPAAPSGFGSLASGIMNGLKNNSATLLALGAGFAGAPNIGQGISRAASAAIPASQADMKNRLLMQNQTQTLQALLAAKVPANMALAALTNPEIMKAVSARYLETKPLQHVMQKDALGGDVPMTFNPNTGKYHDAAGNEIKADAAAVGSSGASAGVLLAPGVKYDANKSGEEYLAQFSPDVQASVKAYINGDVQPSGNPRAKSIATYAKTVAQRYGQDMGIPVSDALFSERRKYRTELATNSANSAGGQAKAFNQAVEHADALAAKLEKLGNVDPLGVPSVSRGLNWTREALSTKQAGIAKEAGTIGQTLAGEVGKLFSGSAGGGVHERELTRKRFDTVNSPAELAGALEGTLETMEGGLKALEQRRDQVLGPNNNVEFVNKETKEKIARIREAIKRLRGEAPAAATAPPAGKTGTGVQWSIVQ